MPAAAHEPRAPRSPTTERSVSSDASGYRKRRAYHCGSLKSLPFIRIGLQPSSRSVFESRRSAACASRVGSGGVRAGHSTGGDVATVRSTPSPSVVTAEKQDPRPSGNQRIWQIGPAAFLVGRGSRPMTAAPSADALCTGAARRFPAARERDRGAAGARAAVFSAARLGMRTGLSVGATSANAGAVCARACAGGSGVSLTAARRSRAAGADAIESVAAARSSGASGTASGAAEVSSAPPAVSFVAPGAARAGAVRPPAGLPAAAPSRAPRGRRSARVRRTTPHAPGPPSIGGRPPRTPRSEPPRSPSAATRPTASVRAAPARACETMLGSPRRSMPRASRRGSW